MQVSANRLVASTENVSPSAQKAAARTLTNRRLPRFRLLPTHDAFSPSIGTQIEDALIAQVLQDAGPDRAAPAAVAMEQEHRPFIRDRLRDPLPQLAQRHVNRALEMRSLEFGWASDIDDLGPLSEVLAGQVRADPAELRRPQKETNHP